MASASSTKTEIGSYLIETDGKALGRGNYDVIVFKGKHVLANYEVAAKRYQVGKGFPEALNAFREEGLLMTEIPHHPNTIQIFACVQTDGIREGEQVFELWLILEFCPLGDLKKFANNTEKDISLSQKVDLMIQSARGLQHLHKYNLLHRDIKPAHLLVAGTEDKPVIKLAGMGESKFVAGTMHTITGTKPFMAPELKQSTASTAYYDKSVDTYALGCTCYALLEHRKGKGMFPKVEGEFICTYLLAHPSADLAALIIKEDDSNTEAELKRLFSTMMAFDPTTRPSIQHVINSLSDIQTSLDDNMSTSDLNALVEDWAWSCFHRSTADSRKVKKLLEKQQISMELDLKGIQYVNEAPKYEPEMDDPAMLTPGAGTPTSNVLFQTSFMNKGDKPQRYSFRTSKTTKRSFEVKLEDCCTQGFDMSVTMKTPWIIDAKVGYSREMVLRKSERQCIEDEMTWEVDTSLEVKGKHRAEAKLVILEEEYSGEVVIRSKIKGRVRAVFTNIKDNNSCLDDVEGNIYEIVKQARKEGRVKGDAMVVDGTTRSVLCTTKGSCKFKYGLRQDLEYEEFPLDGAKK